MATTNPRPEPSRPAPDQSGLPPRKRSDIADAPGKAGEAPPTQDHADPGPEGATEDQVGDRTGPGVGYDQEHPQEPDEGGVGVS